MQSDTKIQHIYKTTHQTYYETAGEWRARRTIGCRGGNRNWNGGGEGEVGGEEQKIKQIHNKVTMITNRSRFPVSHKLIIYCRGSFSKCIFTEHFRTGSLGNMKIWNPTRFQIIFLKFKRFQERKNTTSELP